MASFFGVYLKHAALNVGQAAQGLRYFCSHPDVDRTATRGTLHHTVRSMLLRTKRVLNDVFFAVLPPQTHHSAEELAQFGPISVRRWFLYGYCAWRFDENGAPLDPLPPDVDRRWDPRCM